jgi:hypothetical protein
MKMSYGTTREHLRVADTYESPADLHSQACGSLSAQSDALTLTESHPLHWPTAAWVDGRRSK